MKLLEKILVATDFQRTSDDALEMAIYLAKTFHSDLTLIHVIPEIKGFHYDKGPIRKKVREKLSHLEIDLKKKGVGSVESILRIGVPSERIIEYSEELEVNVIIVGSGQGEKKFPLGTTAERVMIDAERPVLIVKQGFQPPVQHILCPVDFLEPSRRALNNAIHLARTFGARLTVLTVFEPLLSSYFGSGRTPGESKEKVFIKRQQQQFDRFLRGFHFEGLEWQKILSRGKPYQEILRAIRQPKTDLLIMGSLGRTGFSRKIMGSTTEKVAREMPCSVVTLKEEHLLRFDLEREVTRVVSHFKKGMELIDQAFLQEAIGQFEYCLKKDPLYLPAWEALANAYGQLGQEKEAKRYREMADTIRKHLWNHRIIDSI